MAQSKATGAGAPSAKSAASPSSAGKLSVVTLAIMNIVAVVSLRGLPAEAEYGLGSIFYYVFAAIVFLIPVSLVAAASWPWRPACWRLAPLRRRWIQLATVCAACWRRGTSPTHWG